MGFLKWHSEIQLNGGEGWQGELEKGWGRERKGFGKVWLWILQKPRLKIPINGPFSSIPLAVMWEQRARTYAQIVPYRPCLHWAVTPNPPLWSVGVKVHLFLVELRKGLRRLTTLWARAQRGAQGRGGRKNLEKFRATALLSKHSKSLI